MKKFRNTLWGIFFIAIGVILCLNVLNITDINIFFDGWWTLFIIVPCFIGLFSKGDKTGNLIGIAIGVLLLLSAQDVFDLSLVWKLLIPVLIIIVGVKLIFKDAWSVKVRKKIEFVNKENDGTRRVICATFSGQNIKYDLQVFDGADLTATFGGIELDLRNAIIDRDVVINVSAIFGGVDIMLPENVNVKIASTNVFGGTSEKRKSNESDSNVTVYVSSTCVFGGCDIK